MANPTGIATAQGRGEAQVLNPTQRDYYKTKTAEAAERKQDAQKSVAAAVSKTPWSRDMPLFKDKVTQLKQFYNDRAYDLMKGDFDAQVELEAMQNDIINFADQSKAAEKYYLLNEQANLKDPTKFYEKDLEKHKAYAGTPGDFGTYSLRGRFDPVEFDKTLRDQMAKVQVNQGMPYEKNGLYIQRGQADPEEVRANAITVLESYRDLYGPEQVDTYLETIGGEEGFLKASEGLVKDTLSYKVKPQPRDTYTPGQGEAAVFNFSSTPTVTSMNTAYGLGEDANPGEIAYNEGNVSVINQVPFETVVSFKGRPSVDAVPLSGEFKRDVIRDGETTTIGGEVGSGKSFVIPDVKKGFEGNWVVRESGIMPAFPKGYKSKNNVDLGGFLVDDESMMSERFQTEAGGKPEMRYYVTMENEFGDQVLEPLYKVLPAIKQQYKSKADSRAWNEFYNKTKEFLKQNGYSQAYKDFTGKNIKGGSVRPKNNVSSRGVEFDTQSPL